MAAGVLAASAGPAQAFTPDAHDDAVDGALKGQIGKQTLALLRYADIVSDEHPYWSDGQAHCDDFDHFSYRHGFRVRDFEEKKRNVRPDTPAELRASKGYYYDFQTSRAARHASDLQLLGCVRYAFDRINLAVHLAGDLLDTSGRQNRATRRDVRCREVPGHRETKDAKGRLWLPSWNDEYEMRPDDTEDRHAFFTDEVKPNPKCNVIEQFGRGLHAVQDFYAHSNWADSEITTNARDFAYKEKIGTWANPKGLKHTTPFPLFDFARLGVRPVDYNTVRPAALAGTGWRQFPPRLEAKKKTGLRTPDGRLFYLARFDQFRRQYLAAHHNRYPLDEALYRELQSGCHTEQTVLGNRICWNNRQLGHYGFPSPARANNPDWALSKEVAGLAKDSLLETTDRAAADLKTGKLPASKADAKQKAARSSFTNAVKVATADTVRQWKYFQNRLVATYGPSRAALMLHILTQDQKES
ncbi:hypothetical protein ACFUCQ_02500 [Streptomyces sp. NPDC057197]|uniref:hypothetical protein n=1 Tax=Streptomyces sp. NPDC057197 TaxID=3346045 RepID=UPI0036368070